MAKIQDFVGYSDGSPPAIPRPTEPVPPIIVTAQDGLPISYPGCHGIGVRVVHPANPNAPAKNMGLVLFYLPPHVSSAVGGHETEETYCILEGRGLMTFGTGEQHEVKKGDFVYLRPWCEHGIENTGTETLVVLIATSPPNP